MNTTKKQKVIKLSQKTRSKAIDKNNYSRRKKIIIKQNNTKRIKENSYKLLKVQKGGASFDDVIKKYAEKIFKLLEPNGQFSTIFRGLFNLQYLNGFNNMYDEITPTVQEKTIQINLRLFCWIRDNVPGSVTVIKKGSIFSRTLSRDSFEQLNIYMINPSGVEKAAKPGIFANTSILANGTVNVSSPIDSVIFLKATRDIIYLNIIPFLHLFGTGWKDRLDMGYSTAGLAAYLSVRQIFGSTQEWSISKPLQAMEMDGIICTDPVESLSMKHIASGDFFLKKNPNMKKNQVAHVCGKQYGESCSKSVSDNNNQVFIGQEISNRKPTDNYNYWFPEFLTFVYPEDTFLKMISLTEEYNAYFKSLQKNNWPNNIKQLASPIARQNIEKKYRLDFKTSKGYYSVSEEENGTNIWNWADEKLLKKSGDNDIPDRTSEQIIEKLGRNHSRLRKYFEKDNNKDIDNGGKYPFIIYSLDIYNDVNFRKFGLNMTNISDIEFSQIKPSDYFNIDSSRQNTPTMLANQSLISNLLSQKKENPYTGNDYNKLVQNTSQYYKENIQLDYSVYIGPLYGISDKIVENSYVIVNNKSGIILSMKGNDCLIKYSDGTTETLNINNLQLDASRSVSFEKNINLLNLLHGQLCNDEDLIKVPGPLNKQRMVCNIESMPTCDADHYPGGFMDLKETATNNFYYDENNDKFVSELTKNLLDEIIRNNEPMVKNRYQTTLKKQIIYVIISKIDLSQFILYYFYMDILGKSNDDNEKNKVKQVIKLYNDGGLYLYVKQILNYNIENSIIGENDERNLILTNKIIGKTIFNVIMRYVKNSPILDYKANLGMITDFKSDSKAKAKMVENFFLGKKIKDSEIRTTFSTFLNGKIYLNRIQFIIDRFQQSAKCNLILSKKLKAVVEGPPDEIQENIIQYIADILFYEKEEGFEFETSVREAINNIKAEFTKNNILDKRLNFLNNMNNAEEKGFLYNIEDFRVITDNSSRLNSNIIPLFCNIYLKGGTAFRLLFNRELMLEKNRYLNGKKIPINRLQSWEPVYSDGATETDIKKAKKEAELRLNKKLGDPSDYDLNCCINPWLGEHDYNKIKETLNIIIMYYMKMVVYPQIASIYGPYIKTNKELSKKEMDELNERDEYRTNLAALLQSNPYNKTLYIVPNLEETTLTSWREKIDGTKTTTLRNNIDNIEDNEQFNIDIVAKETNNLLPHEWVKYYPQFIEKIDNNRGIIQNSFKDQSFSFYSRGHMLWITEKMLDESTEFDLHRLMLQVPLKSVYINNEENEKGAKQVNQITTDLIKLSDVDDIKNGLTEEQFNKYITVNMNNQVKKVESKSIVAIELIDISVINWGGIEKFTKWHDATDLRSDSIFAINDRVLFNMPNNKNDNVEKNNAIVTNVYSITGYYDVLLVDKKWNNYPLNQDIEKYIKLRVQKDNWEDLAPNEPYISEITNVKNWSNNLQLCSFSHAIQDLSLVIDDNIRSGRIRKLIKRQRRRAFLSQLRYLFVETPDKKSFNDLEQGPISLLRLEGYEDSYDLLDQPIVATNLIKAIFNTNIYFSKDYGSWELYPAISVLSLENWERIYVLLITTITAIDNEYTTQNNNLNQSTYNVIITRLVLEYLKYNIRIIFISLRNRLDNDVVGIKDEIIKYFLNMLTLLAEYYNIKSDSITRSMRNINIMFTAISMLDDTFALCIILNYDTNSYDSSEKINIFLNARYMHLKELLSIIMESVNTHMNTELKKTQLLLQTDFLSMLATHSLDLQDSSSDNPKIIFDKQTLTSLYSSLSYKDPSSVNLSTYTLYYSDFNKYNYMKKIFIEASGRSVVGSLSNYTIDELNSNNDSISFNIMGNYHNIDIPEGLKESTELYLPEYNSKTKHQYVPTKDQYKNNPTSWRNPDDLRETWVNNDQISDNRSPKILMSRVPHSSYNLFNEIILGQDILQYTKSTSNLNSDDISKANDALTNICSWMYTGEKVHMGIQYLPVSVVNITNKNMDNLINWSDQVSALVNYENTKGEFNNYMQIVFSEKFWKNTLKNWNINITDVTETKGRIYIVDAYTNMKILRKAIFESENIFDMLNNTIGYLNFKNTNIGGDIKKLKQENQEITDLNEQMKREADNKIAQIQNNLEEAKGNMINAVNRIDSLEKNAENNKEISILQEKLKRLQQDKLDLTNKVLMADNKLANQGKSSPLQETGIKESLASVFERNNNTLSAIATILQKIIENGKSNFYCKKLDSSDTFVDFWGLKKSLCIDNDDLPKLILNINQEIQVMLKYEQNINNNIS